MSSDTQNNPVKLEQVLLSLFYKWRRVRLREAKDSPKDTKLDFDHHTDWVSFEVSIIQFCRLALCAFVVLMTAFNGKLSTQGLKMIMNIYNRETFFFLSAVIESRCQRALTYRNMTTSLLAPQHWLKRHG